MINLDLGWLVGILGALVAYGALKSRNKANTKAKEYERRVEAINESKEIRDEVDSMGDDVVSDALKRGWVRKK